MKNRLEINSQDKRKHPCDEVMSIPKQMPRTKYSLSLSANIRDLGISSLKFFSYKKERKTMDIHAELLDLRKNLKQLDERTISTSIENIEKKYQTGVHFFYPIMNPIKTHLNKLQKILLTIEKAKKKFDTYKKNMEAKCKKINNLGKIDIIKLTVESRYNKLLSEIEIYTSEINHRKKMLSMLKQLKMPNGLKSFMEEVNQLSVKEKQSLLGLLSTKNQLSPKNNYEKNAFELMFAYEEGKDDFVIGIRSHYDLNHPHPTLIGGINPTVMVAGTIDLCIEDQKLKIATVRIDSGHYRPDVEALELIARYFKYSLDPQYYGNLKLHNFNDEAMVVFPKGTLTNNAESVCSF